MREMSILVGFVNHPLLLREAFDYFADLELTSPELERLRSAVIDVYADGHPHTREEILAELDRRMLLEPFQACEQKLQAVASGASSRPRRSRTRAKPCARRCTCSTVTSHYIGSSGRPRPRWRPTATISPTRSLSRSIAKSIIWREPRR